MPSIVTLPPRSNAIQYDLEDVQEVADMLNGLPRGQAVALDERFDTESKARSRGRVMATMLVPFGISARSHAVVAEENSKGEPTSWAPAVSINRKRTAENAEQE